MNSATVLDSILDGVRADVAAREARVSMAEVKAAGLYPYFKPISDSEDTVVTIEGEAEPQSWILPVLDPGGVYSETVTLTTPDAGETLRLEAVVGKPEIDDTPERNTQTLTLFPDGIPLYLPFVAGS